MTNSLPKELREKLIQPVVNRMENIALDARMVLEYPNEISKDDVLEELYSFEEYLISLANHTRELRYKLRDDRYPMEFQTWDT